MGHGNAKVISLFSDKKQISQRLKERLRDLVVLRPFHISPARGYSVEVGFEIDHGIIDLMFLSDVWIEIQAPQQPGKAPVPSKKLYLDIEAVDDFAFTDEKETQTDGDGKEWVSTSRRLTAWTKPEDKPIVIDPCAMVKVFVHTRRVFTIVEAVQVLPEDPDAQGIILPLHRR